MPQLSPDAQKQPFIRLPHVNERSYVGNHTTIVNIPVAFCSPVYIRYMPK